jgi:hypothetical protein
MFISKLTFAFGIGINISYYNGTSLGLVTNIGNWQLNLDGIYKSKSEEMFVYDYNYTELTSHEINQTSLGIRLNFDYVKTINKFSLQIGPIGGFDRYWFKTKASMPLAADTYQLIDSTIIYNQWEIGVNTGINYNISDWIVICASCNIGYLSWFNVSTLFLVKHHFSKFDVLENKIGIVFYLKRKG